MVQMMAVHLDRPECDAGYSGTLLSKDEESEPKELACRKISMHYYYASRNSMRL